MKATEAKFTKRIVVADFEFEEYTLGGVVGEGETGVQALNSLKTEVVAVINGETTEVVETTKPAKKQKTKKEKAHEPKTDHSDDEVSDDEDSASEDAELDGEGDQDDEATDSEDGDDGDDSSDTGEDDKDGDDDSDEEIPAAKAKSKKGSAAKETVKKGFRKKPQVYNRSLEQHKNLFSGVLRSVAPDWKKSEASKAKAKKVSGQMSGKEFLDENGLVLPAFTAEVKKLMASKK